MRGSIRSLSLESFLRKFHGGVGHVKKIRTLLSVGNRQDLMTLMKAAYTDLLKQVEHAFIMQPAAKKIVLVACCGEWWSWMIGTRAEHLQELTLPDSLNPEDENEVEVEEVEEDEEVDEAAVGGSIPHDIPKSRREQPHRAVKKSGEGMYRDESPPPPVEFDKIPYKPRKTALGDGERIEENTNPIFIRYTELGEGLIEPVKPNVEDAMALDDAWSLPILFGSEASAQRFYLIHRFLEAAWQERGAQDQVKLNLSYTSDVILRLTGLNSWKDEQ
jgi:hypothetical protein